MDARIDDDDDESSRLYVDRRLRQFSARPTYVFNTTTFCFVYPHSRRTDANASERARAPIDSIPFPPFTRASRRVSSSPPSATRVNRRATSR